MTNGTENIGDRADSVSLPRWIGVGRVVPNAPRLISAAMKGALGITRPTLVLAFCVLLSGCTLLRGPKKDRTEFLNLEATAVPVADTEAYASRLLLRTVEVPAYLQRSKALAVREKSGDIHYVDLAWWSEPLDLAFARVLRADLERLHVPTAARRDQDFTQEVHVRIDCAEGVVADGKGRVEFSASFELRRSEGGPNAVVRRTFAAEPVAWDGKDHAALARALSKSVADLAAQIRAAAVRR